MGRNVLETVGVRRKINAPIHNRENILGGFQQSLHNRTLAFDVVAIPLLHTSQKYCFVAAIENQLRILDLADDLKKLHPNILFVYIVIRPKRALNNRGGTRNSQANEIVGITVRRSFNVNIYGSACDGQLRLPNYIDLFLPNRESLEGM